MMDLLDNSQGPTGFSQSGTFSAHPVAMATGLATLKALRPEVYDHLNGLGDRLKSGLEQQFADQGVEAHIVVTGSIFSVHFKEGPLANYRDLAHTDQTLAHRVFLSLVNQGYFLSSGLSMCALSSPMTERHIDGLVEAMGRAVEEARKEG